MTDRRIPLLMATQHPDSTVKVPTSREVEEAIESFTIFGCDEVMVDYEGKLTPYHQPEWIVEKAFEQGLKIGREFLISIRTPNDRLEETSRHIHSLMTALLTNAKAYRLGLEPSVKYVIIPMMEDPIHAMIVQRRLLKLQTFGEEELGLRPGYMCLTMPLLETVNKHLRIHQIVEAFRISVLKYLGIHLEYLRVFLGKSDAALLKGHIASTLSLKIALSRLNKWGEEEYVEVYPIIGMGKPPFRGYLTPSNIDRWVKEWRGYRTVTIQSALRYNTEKKDYEYLKNRLAMNRTSKAATLDEEDEKNLIKIIEETSKAYTQKIKEISDIVLKVSEYIPNTRERISFKEYGRRKGETILPRAITFTATCYTIGLPPTLLDLPALNKLLSRFYEILTETYNVLPDYEYDLSYYNEEILSKWLPKETYEKICSEIRETINSLGLSPKQHVDEEYWVYAEKVYENISQGNIQEASKHILQMAEMRGFLG